MVPSVRSGSERHSGGMKLFVALVLGLFLAGCSGTNGSEVVEQGAAVEPTAVSTTGPVAQAPTPTPYEPATPAAEEPTAPAVVTLWFTQYAPDSGDGAEVFAYERASELSAGASEDERLRERLNLWLEGPERTGFGRDHPTGYFRPGGLGCESKVEFERSDSAIVVTLCGDFGAETPIGEEIAISSLSATLAEVGFDDVALIVPFGDQCIGNRTAEDSLACVPDALRVPEEEGVRCPLGRARRAATVEGVYEWMNTRSGPSTGAPVVGRLDAGAEVQMIRSTMRIDAEGRWWVQAENPNTDRCLWVAADFLVDDGGGFVGSVTPGITYELPETRHWSFRRNGGLGGGQWSLDEGSNTAIWIVVEPGNLIDEHVANIIDIYDRSGYDQPQDWYKDWPVPGADRAVEPVGIPSETGDTADMEVLMEIGAYTVTAQVQLYIEDFGLVPEDELRNFLASIEIDPAVFLANLPS